MTAPAPMPQPSRDPYSHVDATGNPKRSFETERAATIAVARVEGEQPGIRFTWYVCSQRPEHWHIAKVRIR